MLTPSLIITPLIAGFVGYYTNEIAIKMLFRPHKPKYLFGRQLPFTPGLIPKERKRVAASVGESISRNLMNQDVLRTSLLSDEMQEKVGHAIDQYVESLRKETVSLRVFLTRFLPSDEVGRLEQSVERELTLTVSEKLMNCGLGEQIAHLAVEHALSKMQGGVMGLFGADRLMRHLQEPAERLLQKHLDEMLETNAGQMTETLIKSGLGEFFSTPVGKLLEGREEQIFAARNNILRLYRTVVEQQLPSMLEALDVRQIIENRINEMDIGEVERIIFEVMHKELRAIVWFGAGLGLLIGLLNVVFVQALS